MSIKHLKTLIEIADCGGFSAAAERLFITQSAVSMQIKALEDDWRVTLFDRSTRPPVLNQQGWMLVPRARALVDQYEALKGGAATHELIGSLRIGVVPSAATALLPHVLFDLRQDYPGLTMRAESGLSSELLFKVGQGRLDAAIVTEPDRLDLGLVAELIRAEDFKLFAHRDLMLPDVDEMLRRCPFIRFSPAMGVGRIVDEALRARGIKVNGVLELDSIEAILEMVRLGLGIAALPEQAASRRLADVRVSPLEPRVQRRLVLVARREYAALPAIRLLGEAFRAVAAIEPADPHRQQAVSAGVGTEPRPRTEHAQAKRRRA